MRPIFVIWIVLIVLALTFSGFFVKEDFSSPNTRSPTLFKRKEEPSPFKETCGNQDSSLPTPLGFVTPYYDWHPS